MLNLRLISVDYQNAKFGIYAFPTDETSDYKIESFDISVKFDPAVWSAPREVVHVLG